MHCRSVSGLLARPDPAGRRTARCARAAQGRHGRAAGQQHATAAIATSERACAHRTTSAVDAHRRGRCRARRPARARRAWVAGRRRRCGRAPSPQPRPHVRPQPRRRAQHGPRRSRRASRCRARRARGRPGPRAPRAARYDSTRCPCELRCTRSSDHIRGSSHAGSAERSSTVAPVAAAIRRSSRREARRAAVQRPQERRSAARTAPRAAPRTRRPAAARRRDAAGRRAGRATGTGPARSLPPIRIVTRSARSSSARGICRSSTSGTVRLRTARLAYSSGSAPRPACDSSSARRSAQPRYSPGCLARVVAQPLGDRVADRHVPRPARGARGGIRDRRAWPDPAFAAIASA